MIYKVARRIGLFLVVAWMAWARGLAQDQTSATPSPPQPPAQNATHPQQPQDQPPAPPPEKPANPPAQESSQQEPSQQPANSPENPSPQNQTPPEQNPPPAGQPDAEEKKKDDSPSPAAAVMEATKDAAAEAAQATKQVAQETLIKVRDWETEWFVGAYVGRNRPLVPLSAEARKDLFLHQTFLTPGAYLDRMFDAGIDQARGSPYQWGGGLGGYGARFASRQGQFFAANSLAALANAKLRYEPRYDQCKCTGFWPRVRHAVARNFLTYNQTEQETRPQLGLYAGAFGGGVISTAWKPKPRNAFAEGGRGMAGQVAWGTLLNLFTEFAVDINRKLGMQNSTSPSAR